MSAENKNIPISVITEKGVNKHIQCAIHIDEIALKLLEIESSLVNLIDYIDGNPSPGEAKEKRDLGGMSLASFLSGAAFSNEMEVGDSCLIKIKEIKKMLF